MKGGVRSGGRGIRVGCDHIWFRVKAHSLILESVICGRSKDTPMDNAPCIFSEDLESHCIPNIGCNPNPPACFLLGRWERLIRVKVENAFIESKFEEGGDVLKSTMSYFSWNLITQSFFSAYVVDISNVFTSKEPAVIRCTSLVEEDLGLVLEELHSTEFGGVLLRVVGFLKLVFDEMLSVDLVSNYGCSWRTNDV